MALHRQPAPSDGAATVILTGGNDEVWYIFGRGGFYCMGGLSNVGYLYLGDLGNNLTGLVF